MSPASAARTGPPLRPASATDRLALTRSEGRVAELSGRRFIELEDAFLVFDPDAGDTWRTWLGCVRFPDAPAAFERRFVETLTLFATLGRRPCVRAEPGADQPPDLAARLVVAGFVAHEASYRMRLDRDSAPETAAAARPPASVTIEILGSLTGRPDAHRATDRDGTLTEQATAVMAASFGVAPRRADELLASLASPGSVIALVHSGRHPVAAGRVAMRDGFAYLSAIGVDPRWQRQGFGRLVTAALADCAFAAGAATVHLNVDVVNVQAWNVYADLGFASVGAPAIRFVLARS